jgi:tRNA (guanine-N7-)-methyltransferase
MVLYSRLVNDYTLTANQLPWPAEWAAIFGRQAPLFVEIGFGNAGFLVDLGSRRPEANILGLEISRPSLLKAERKLNRASLDNVRLIQATAQFVIWALCRTESIQDVYVNFPDPWPRESHHWRRLISDKFLHLLATRMIANGRLNIATDHSDYASWISDHLARCPYFDSCQDGPVSHDDPARFRTKYEQKAQVAGSLCYYFQWQRNAVPVTEPIAMLQELPMPHVILEGPDNLSGIARHFQPQDWLYSSVETGTIVVRLIDLYVSQGHPTLVIDTFIGEGPFGGRLESGQVELGPPAERPLEQRLLLAITRRADGNILIRLQETGFPRPTRGVHFALDRLADWLSSLDPPFKRVRDNLHFSAD